MTARNAKKATKSKADAKFCHACGIGTTFVNGGKDAPLCCKRCGAPFGYRPQPQTRLVEAPASGNLPRGVVEEVVYQGEKGEVKEVPPQRELQVKWKRDDYMILDIIKHSNDGKPPVVSSYFVECLIANGSIYTFTKLEYQRKTVYQVWLSSQVCSCQHYNYTQSCKHLEALRALKKSNKL